MRTTGAVKASRGGQTNGRHGLDPSAIDSVKEVCGNSTDDDIQAALLEYSGDVQAAVMSLLDNPFHHVEKKKKKTLKPMEREERHSNRDFSYRDSDRRGPDRNRGRGRGGDRTFDSDAPSRGRGRGGRGRGRGPPREPEPVQPSVEETSPLPPLDVGMQLADFAAPPEEVPTPPPPKVQNQTQQALPRTAVHAVVSPAISWASKVKKGATAAQSAAEPEAVPEYDHDSEHHEQEPEPMVNGMAEEPIPAEATPVMRPPAEDDFGSGFGHEAMGNAWDSAQPQVSAWSTAAVASSDVTPQRQLPEQPQHPAYADAPPGIPTSQPFTDNKPFDLRDLGSTLPAASAVVDDSKPPDFFDMPQEPSSKPPGFGPPGLQQGSPLNMFTGRSVSGTEVTGGTGAAEPASFMGGGFGGQFSQAMPPASGQPSQHQAQHRPAAQQPAALHSQGAAQQARSQQVPMPQHQQPQQQPQQPQRGQQDVQTGQPAPIQGETHGQQAFEPQFHSAQRPRSPTGKAGAPSGMFMGDSLGDEHIPEHSRSQSQTGPQGGQSGEKQRVGDDGKGPGTASEQPSQQMHTQAYQQLPQDVGSWGMPAMQPDMAYMQQRPGSAQLTPAMQGIVPGMGQMPNQMQAQYPMNPNMGAPGYAYHGAPAPSYQQMGYASPAAYMQASYNMQFNQYPPPYGQMPPQAYASPQGQIYGAPTANYGKQAYMDNYGGPGGAGSGGMSAGGGRGRGRGKSQKGRMPPGYAQQGGMQADAYGAGQGFAGNFDQSWMGQNPRGYESGFGKDKQGGQPPFAAFAYDNQQYPGYAQYGQQAQFQQHSWNGQDKGFGGPKGNY